MVSGADPDEGLSSNAGGGYLFGLPGIRYSRGPDSIGSACRIWTSAAVLLQRSGWTNALHAPLVAEQQRGSDFLGLANALSALYPKDAEEKRLLDAMLLAVPRWGRAMRPPILTLRVKGPTTKGGRMPLSALLQLGTHIQAAVERVGRVLVGQMDSRRPGRKPQEILQECGLEVVALNRGSFEMALDLPRTKFELMDLGVSAVEHLLEGVEVIAGDGGELPAGYDLGVLHSLRDIGSLLGDGIDAVEIEGRTKRYARTIAITPAVHERVARLIRSPVSNLRTVEGRLLMADFRHAGERCRLHPPMGEPISCRFDEALAERVYEYLRGYVRITGEAQEDPSSGRVLSLNIRDIDLVRTEGEVFDGVHGEAFWQDTTLERLAEEQGVQSVRRLEDVFGAGADMWETDEDFHAFLTAIEPSGTPGV